MTSSSGGPATSSRAAPQTPPGHTPLELPTRSLAAWGAEAVIKWGPGDVIPVRYPDPPEPYLVEAPDLPVQGARDIFVDANLWLPPGKSGAPGTSGTPPAREASSPDPPPDATLRPDLDYRLLDGATIGDRETFYVYDAANR